MSKQLADLDPNAKGKLYLTSPGSYKDPNTVEVFHGVKVKNIGRALRHRHAVTSAFIRIQGKRLSSGKRVSEGNYEVPVPAWNKKPANAL